MDKKVVRVEMDSGLRERAEANMRKMGVTPQDFVRMAYIHAANTCAAPFPLVDTGVKRGRPPYLASAQP